MTDPVWLTLEIVRALHAESVARFGGSVGERDSSLLESALDRPRNLFACGNDPSLFEMAAAYCAGIVKNHPFVDGNKRAGALAAAAFLDLNGQTFDPDEAELAITIMALAAGELDEGALGGWIEASCTPREA